MPDRIIFPRPSNGFVHPDYELYPKNKSMLEIQLDLFFHLERSEKTKKQMFLDLPGYKFSPRSSDELIDNTTPRITAASAHFSGVWLEKEKELHEDLRDNVSGIANVPLRTLPDTYFRPTWRFRSGELWPHQSWFGEYASEWLRTPIEMFQPEFRNVSTAIVIDLAELGDTLSSCLLSHKLAKAIEASGRDQDLKFSLRYTSPPMMVDQEFLEEIGLSVDYLWTGLRRTPATNNLIVSCIHKFCVFAGLFLAGFSNWDTIRVDDARLSLCRDRPDADVIRTTMADTLCYNEEGADYLKLEYTPLGGHSRRANLLCADLAPAIRPDLGELVDVISLNDVLSVDRALVGDHIQQMIYPQYLFDFEMFVGVFITSILPYEAFLAGAVRRTPPELAFNPRAIKIVGLG
jgi:hypothetical protein